VAAGGMSATLSQAVTTGPPSGVASIQVMSSFQDAVVLGGTRGGNDGTMNSQFGGYGTCIENVYFENVRRAVFYHSAANTNTFRDSIIWSGCGGANDFVRSSLAPHPQRSLTTSRPRRSRHRTSADWYMAIPQSFRLRRLLPVTRVRRRRRCRRRH
jgi:hypothetical protein